VAVQIRPAFNPSEFLRTQHPLTFQRFTLGTARERRLPLFNR
jgi:hypothetical protein